MSASRAAKACRIAARSASLAIGSVVIDANAQLATAAQVGIACSSLKARAASA